MRKNIMFNLYFSGTILCIGGICTFLYGMVLGQLNYEMLTQATPIMNKTHIWVMILGSISFALGLWFILDASFINEELHKEMKK